MSQNVLILLIVVITLTLIIIAVRIWGKKDDEVAERICPLETNRNSENFDVCYKCNLKDLADCPEKV